MTTRRACDSYLMPNSKIISQNICLGIENYKKIISLQTLNKNVVKHIKIRGFQRWSKT